MLLKKFARRSGPCLRFLDMEQPNAPQHPMLKQKEATGLPKRLTRKEQATGQQSSPTKGRAEPTEKRTVRRPTHKTQPTWNEPPNGGKIQRKINQDPQEKLIQRRRRRKTVFDNVRKLGTVAETAKPKAHTANRTHQTDQKIGKQPPVSICTRTRKSRANQQSIQWKIVQRKGSNLTSIRTRQNTITQKAKLKITDPGNGLNWQSTRVPGMHEVPRGNQP